MTLEDFLDALERAEDADPRQQRQPDFCDSACLLVGAARDDPTLCSREPWRIVSMCALDWTSSPDQPCGTTVCFEATELAAYLASAAAAGGAVRNPLLQDPVAVEALRQRGLLDEVREHLSDATVEALRSGSLFRCQRPGRPVADRPGGRAPRRAQRRALRPGPLPADAAHPPRHRRPADEARGQGARRGAAAPHRLALEAVDPPARATIIIMCPCHQWMRRVLMLPANAVLFVLNHPYLSTVALMLTKVVRMVLCLVTFGVTQDEWKALMRSVLDAVDPRGHFPMFTSLLGMVGVMLECLSAPPPGCVRITPHPGGPTVWDSAAAWGCSSRRGAWARRWWASWRASPTAS